jgi:hypothetical protein
MLSIRILHSVMSHNDPYTFPTRHLIYIVRSRMVSSGMLRRVALVRTDVSEELCVSFIRVKRISELGTTQAATS